MPVVAVALTLLGLLRWTLATTCLHVDPAGLRFQARGGGWSTSWDAVRDVVVRTPWEGTQPGGASAGVRLVLLDGRVRDIPDTLELRRDQLATLIRAYWTAAGPSRPRDVAGP